MVFDPFCGTPSLMPARRASDRPMAMACWRERTLPLLWCRACISSRMNSPACVEGFLPARASRRARFNAIALGMMNLLLVVAIHDRQTPHLALAHDHGGLFDRLVLVGPDDAFGHR